MIDPLLSLALTIHSNPGTYALLIGSGVSRAARIPTGWEITLDLISRLAVAQGAEAEPHPEEWYRENFDEEPDYSNLLQSIAGAQAERQAILRSYFEPTDEDREEGRKVPTAAQHAIADLVARGYVQVILTTNFDRLLEQALESAGVHPTVVSSASQVAGAEPLVRGRPMVVKLHGDYRDARIRNTAEELRAYEEELDGLLDQIFDEYGLVVCGWSAEWDPALRSAIERCPSRRYTTYWTARGELSDSGQRLADIRDASVVPINDAEEFFPALVEKLDALEESARPDPRSLEVAVATTKRYLADPKYRIRLGDLVGSEVDRLRAAIRETDQTLDAAVSGGEMLRRVREYEGATEVLQAIFIQGGLWDTSNHARTWIDGLEGAGNRDIADSRYFEAWKNLTGYPALLLGYSIGIACLQANNLVLLRKMLTSPRLYGDSRERHPYVEVIYPMGVFRRDDARRLPGMENRFTPGSDRLFDILREPFRSVIRDDSDYAHMFDGFAYLSGLVYLDLRFGDELEGSVWAPIGRYWQWHNHNTGRDWLLGQVEEDQSWFDAGFFRGEQARFRSLRDRYDDFWRSLPAH